MSQQSVEATPSAAEQDPPAATQCENTAATECVNRALPYTGDYKAEGNHQHQNNDSFLCITSGFFFKYMKLNQWQIPGETAAQSSHIGQCKALYTFTSERDDELTFEEGKWPPYFTWLKQLIGFKFIFFPTGDLIDIYTKGEAGWWFGKLNGKKGHFPATYVEELPMSGIVKSSEGWHEDQNLKTTTHRPILDKCSSTVDVFSLTVF